MVAQEQLTFKTLLLHARVNDAQGLPAYRLLHDMGHDVAETDSASRAVQILQQERADLVVIDADRDEQELFFDSINALPASQQPRQVAIFADAAEQPHRQPPRLGSVNVQVLLKPLHVHGLLGILRRIEGKA